MRSVTLLRWTVVVAVAVAMYQAAVFYLGYETSAAFNKVWSFVFPFLLAFWVEEDSKTRPEVDRPSFDIGLFVYLVWIFYLPFYLLRTRGAKGWIWIGGLLTLAFLGTILQLAIHAAG